MAWNYDDEEIYGIIDANLKDSPPNPPAVNTAPTVRALLKSYWSAIRGQVSGALGSTDLLLEDVQTKIDTAFAKSELIYEQFSLASGIGTYNATTGIATITETGATFTPSVVANQVNGRYFDIVVAGTKSVTGTPVAMEIGGVLISRGTKWDYIPKGTLLIDPRKSPNLILSANSTPENWLLVGSSTDTQPLIVVQTQPAVITLQKGVKGLGFMYKAVMQPNSRVNYFSNKISLDALPVGEKVHLGYFRYLSAGTVLSASTVHKLWPLPENIDANITMETIDLGGGLQYVRSVSPITVPSYTSRCEIRIYFYAAPGSVVDGEMWFGSPSLIKTSIALAPLMYVGGEDLSSVPSPMTSQNLVSFANFSPDQWILNTSASSIGDKPILYRQSGTVSLISSVKKFKQFSFAVKVAGIQLNSRVNFVSQIIKTNETIAPGTMVSFGFFLNVDTGVDISQVVCQIVDATNLSVGLIAITTEFVNLGNGLRYYRSTIPVSMPSYASNQAAVVAYIYTGAASVTGDIYLASPSLVKSPQKLQPQNYLGMEDAQSDTSGLQSQITANASDITQANSNLSLANTRLRNNSISDAGFLTQSIGAQSLTFPWGLGGLGSNYQAPFVFELTPDGPAGTRCLKQTHSKRSSDGLLSICTIHQTVTIPEDCKGMSKFSYGFWAKRDSLMVKPVSFTLTFYPNIGDTTGSTTSSPALPAMGVALNTWVYLKFENISVPAGTSRINIRSAFIADAASAVDVTCNLWMQTFEVAFNSSVANATNQNFKIAPIDYFNLRGLKFCIYGNSIVAANVTTTNTLLNEARAISDRFLMTVYVRGVGGTRVVDNNSIAWFDGTGLYLARPDNGGTQPVGSFEWKSSMSSLERINNTIPADTDIILIRGLTNDYLNYPLGTIDSPHDNNTIYGAYQLMLDRMYARIPNAIFILATPTHRNGEDTDVGVGAMAGLKFEQVRDAVRVIAKKYKYHLCDMSESGINQLNHATYLSDGIHPNSAGYARTGAVIFKTLKTLIQS